MAFKKNLPLLPRCCNTMPSPSKSSFVNCRVQLKSSMTSKFVLVSTVEDVIRKYFSFLHILNTDVIFAETSGSDGLLVSILSVNDRCQSLTLVSVDGVPDFGDPGASSVDDFDILCSRYNVRHKLYTKPFHHPMHSFSPSCPFF